MAKTYGSYDIRGARRISRKVISDIQFAKDKDGDNTIVFTFSDNTILTMFDSGNYWHHGRKYFHTDDDMNYFIGSQFLSAEVRLGPEKKLDKIISDWTGELAPDYTDGDLIQESEFLIISTNKGQFTIVSYNEHNGYYGGFDLRVNIILGQYN